MEYQWYPGHMTKTRRMIEEDIKLIDLVIEILDARVPYSSRNPDIDRLGRDRARLIILNKADMAEKKLTEEWTAYYKEKGYSCVAIDSRNNSDVKKLMPIILEACRAKIERNKAKGIKNRPVRAMVAGVPNVGKSTFINSFAGKKTAKTGNKPGVTRGKQWIRLTKEVELLDTPGILWPKFEDQSVGEKLALIGAIKDDVLSIYDIAKKIIGILIDRDPGIISERYGEMSCGLPEEYIEEIGKKRGLLKKGGETDIDKAASVICDEFRNGKLGRFTLEDPSVYD